MSLSPKIKVRLKIIALLSVFCSPFLFNIAPARAQGLPVYDNAQNVWSTYKETKEQLESNWEKVQNNFVDAVMMGALKGMEYILNKVAYDLAVSLASGNWGQSPLFQTKSMGNYWAGVAGDALGTALDSFGQGVGFNLCSLPDVKLDLALKMGLHMSYSEPKPSCSWQQLKDTYSAEGITSKYWGADGENFAKMFNTSLQLTDTDLGVAIAAKSKIDAYATNAQAAAKAQREEGGGAKSLTTLISGDIITPAEVNKDMLVKSGKAAQAEKKNESTATYMAAAMQKGSVQVLMNVASTFIETFAGTAMDNFLTKGMFPFGLGKVKCVPSYLKIGGLAIDTCVESKYTADGYYSDGNVSTYRQEAVTLFAEELLVAKSRQVDSYNLLAKFTVCPDNPGPENCILDDQFAQAIRQADAGEPLTIAQAIEKQLIRADWPLIGPMEDSVTERLHEEKECYAGGFCYKNLKVLRKARVLPLGFEIAALVPAKENNKPWTLKEVLDGFYVEDSPFYHLVNPNWVLKLPPSRCKSLVYGTQLINDSSPLRQEECADLQSCVEYDKNGKCIAYGYCLKEKSVWRFNADYCDEQYATCKTFTNSSGKTSSFLSRTLNSEMCDSENIGCRFYSNFKEFPGNVFASGTWGGSGNTVITTPGFYLNKKVETCVADNAGCTAFTTNTLDNASLLYFKKAPDYLGCYDTDNNPQNGVQWPQNLSDFNKLRPIDKNECGKYAAVCLPEEEGCNQYSLVPLSIFKSSVEEIIIGKFTPATSTGSGVIFNDQCPSVCEGYDAYKELANKYSNGKDLVYIVPTAQAMCEPQDEGCSAFINLNATSGGNVQTEYYSNLRLCMTPDQNKQKNFYTYEGRDGGGYKITGYILLKNGERPAQYFRDENEKNTFGICDETKSLTDEDCRAFRDDQGRVYYAFLSKTVVASDRCTPYRAIKSEFYDENFCLGSFDGIKNSVGADGVVFYDNATGFCVYNGLPQNIVASTQSSVACSQDKVSCRRYQGNTGNYVANIFNYDFDAGTGLSNSTSDKVSGWWKRSEGTDNGTQIILSDESSNNIGKSLKATVVAGSSATTRGFKHYNTNIQSSKTYSFSFLAKGTAKWNITLGHGFTYSVGSVTLTDNWRRFEFLITNPTVSGESIPEGEGAQIIFIDDGATGGYIFLDSVVLTEIKDTVYLVKDKLSVPIACDENQTDSLPGPFLGCRAYKTPSSKDLVYLHNFDYLCRQGAVGCTKVYDTNNRFINEEGSDKYIVYNLWLDKENLGLPLTFSGTASTTRQGVFLSCFVERDQPGCYVSKTIMDFDPLTPIRLDNMGGGWGFHVDNSTVVFPPKSNTPSFLVLNKNASCVASAQGCTALGSSILLPDGSREYEDVYIKINPGISNFESALCNDKAEGCDIWRSGPATHYFKDPEIFGNRLCEWKKQETGDYKWTLKGTTSTLCSNGILPSFGSDTYNNEVGICPADQAGCTMYIDRYAQSESKRCTVSGKKCVFDKECTSDPNDVCADPSKEYYLLNNDKIKEAQKKCDGKVSLSSGCILLDQTDNPSKLWDTQVSYALSNSNEGTLVNPISSDNNDANLVLKTTLDRECTLWSYCESYLADRDPDTGKLSSRCYSLGLCEEAQAGFTVEGQCVSPVASTSESNRVLTKDMYQDRSIAWNAEEYTGYSIFNSYQLYDLQVRTLKVKDSNSVSLLVHPESGPAYENICNANTDLILGEESSQTICPSTSGITLPSLPKGYCLGEECIYPARPFDEYDLQNTRAKNLSLDTKRASSLTCRGYPEQDSPFDLWVLTPESLKGGVKSFRSGISEQVNLCASTTGSGIQSCDCSYKKYNYGGEAVYLSNNATLDNYEKGICVGSLKDGIPCDPETCQGTDKTECGACGEDGACTPLKSKNALLGWEGYCLEKDTRFAYYNSPYQAEKTCLTWWPVEVAKGAVDLWVYDESAGWRTSETTELSICAYNNAIKSNINSSAWNCGGSIGVEPYTYSQSLYRIDSGNINKENAEWHLKENSFLQNEGDSLEPLNSFGGNALICGNTIEDDCDDSGWGNDNGEIISWQGNYMYPYFIQGKKFGCETNNEDAGIRGDGESEPLLIKNLPPNSTAYFIYAKDNNQFYSVNNLEQIDKNFITKIEVLISDSVKSGVENHIDNNRLTFYNSNFYKLETDNKNNTDFDDSNDYFISSTMPLDLDENNVCYSKINNNNEWGMSMWEKGENCDSRIGVNGFTIKINWVQDKLNSMGIETKKVRGDYCKKCPICYDSGVCSYDQRGMSFIFIVHYSDGECADNGLIQVKENKEDEKFFAKPVTWRLVEIK